MQEEPSQSEPIMISIYEKAVVEHKKITFFITACTFLHHISALFLYHLMGLKLSSINTVNSCAESVIDFELSC